MIKSRGVPWNELSRSEQKEIEIQFNRLNSNKKFPDILNDPMLEKYQFIKTQQFGWSITNANLLPLKTSRMEL